MKNGDLYIAKDQKTAEFVVRIREVTTDEVRFHAEGGGFVITAPREEFEQTHRVLSDAEMASLLAHYRATLVTGDWMGEDQALKAWDNGHHWNGWLQPMIESDEIERGITEGALANVRYLPDLDACIVITSEEGPESEQFDRIPDLPARVKNAIERDIHAFDVDSHTQVQIHRGHDIQTPDGTVHAFAIGDGWCWEMAEEPEAAPSP